jgi:hypothetical protein
LNNNNIEFVDRVRKLRALLNKYPHYYEEEWDKIRVLSKDISEVILKWQMERIRANQLEKLARKKNGVI